MKKYLLLTVLSFNVSAEVLSAGANGFLINIERTVAVEAATAYAQFLRVNQWWDAEHTWFGDAGNLSIEPVAGGCFCEKSGGREVLHMTVSYVDPGREIRMVGGLGPLQAMGLSGGMTWRFEPHGAGQTKIVHRYQVSGYSPDGLESLAQAVDRVQAGQVGRLAASLSR